MQGRGPRTEVQRQEPQLRIAWQYRRYIKRQQQQQEWGLDTVKEGGATSTSQTAALTESVARSAFARCALCRGAGLCIVSQRYVCLRLTNYQATMILQIISTICLMGLVHDARDVQPLTLARQQACKRNVLELPYSDCNILSKGIATPTVRSEVLFFPHRKNEQSGAGGRSATPPVKKWCHDFDLTRDMSEEQLSRAQLVCTKPVIEQACWEMFSEIRSAQPVKDCGIQASLCCNA